MKTLFADTGYWIALLNPSDELHDRSFQIMLQQNILEALAYDKHFEQAGFVALLRQD
jgi:predicted nucleic acid-binding protein